MKQIISAVIIALGISLSLSLQADSIELEKRDYLKLVVGNFVYGFNEFDTSVTVGEKSVNIGIYYNAEIQDKSRAETLADRFRKQLPLLLANYKWASDVDFAVNVYSESREEGY